MKRLLFLLVLAILLIVPVSSIEIGAFGDSLTSGTYLPEGSTYAYQISLGVSVYTNPDGSGQTSRWGVENIQAHINGSMKHVLIMFGTNDEFKNIQPIETARNLETMYRKATAMGCDAVIVLHPLSTMIDSRRNLTLLDSYLTTLRIPHVAAYDALDSRPGNGLIDEWQDNGNYCSDGLHLTVKGQQVLGKYLRDKIYPALIGISPKGRTLDCGSRCIL